MMPSPYGGYDAGTLNRLLRDPRVGEVAQEKIRAELASRGAGKSSKAIGAVLESPTARKLVTPSREVVKPAPPPVRRAAHVTGRMNKTEQRYAADFLEPAVQGGVSRFYLHERIKLRLADGTWYTPDFFEMLTDGRAVFHEVKGGKIWDDAAVKFKVAAELFPWAAWRKVQWKGGEWRVLREYEPENEAPSARPI